MQTISKMHEKNVQTGVHAEQVSNILSDVENVPFALRGSKVKTILYWLFSVIAAAELSAAFYFYVSSFEVPQAVAGVAAFVLAFFLHGLIHAQLTDTTKGMVFSKHRESNAMSREVRVNIVLSIILLIFVACCVFFLGKKGYTAFREMKYQTATMEARAKDPQQKGLVLTADMLTNKKGKISTDRLEQAAALATASAKATDATVQAATADKQAYDKSTANITDVVGSSAFVLELILALLAYAIATAKFAATFDEIAKRNSPQTFNFNSQSKIEKDKIVKILCELYSIVESHEHFMYDTLTTLNPSFSYNNGILQVDEKSRFAIIQNLTKLFNDERTTLLATENKPETTTQTVTENVTQTVTQPKQIGFSKNSMDTGNNGNEGRTIIKGFQRTITQPKEAITENVTQTVTNEKLRVCEYCDEPYIYGHARQKYCCEDCRITAWQEKNGVSLRKKSKA